MIGKCMGCEEEWAQACDAVREGYHVATTIDDFSDNIGVRGHFFSIVVDDEGKLIWC